KRALVVCGADGMDEITVTGETKVADWDGGKVSTYTVSPEDVGLKRATLEELRGGETAEEAAGQVRAILSGESGPKLDMVLINAGAALMAAGKVDDLAGGVALAREVVASGAALAKLEALVAYC
ncbi:MAG: anthranilate phosphoribosyltransferase, partial [Desulfobulbaceae bacterium]|nr:anthranilate phosphoribosyltransferase [Desulfobulbaceae bacterium]